MVQQFLKQLLDFGEARQFWNDPSNCARIKVPFVLYQFVFVLVLIIMMTVIVLNVSWEFGHFVLL